MGAVIRQGGASLSDVQRHGAENAQVFSHSKVERTIAIGKLGATRQRPAVGQPPHQGALAKGRFFLLIVAAAILPHHHRISHLPLAQQPRNRRIGHGKDLSRAVGFLNADLQITATARSRQIVDGKWAWRHRGLVHLEPILLDRDPGGAAGNSADHGSIPPLAIWQHIVIRRHLYAAEVYAIKNVP
ncbi:hypothetical protein D3C80_1328640 [compost metagenome]